MRKALWLRQEHSEYSRARDCFTRLSILSGCGGFFCAPRMPPTPRSRSFCEVFAKFLPTTSNQILKNDRLWRCDRFRQKIVEIGAILAIFRPFEVLDGKFSDRRARRLRRRRRRLGRGVGGAAVPSTGAAASSAAPPPRARGSAARP